MPHSKGWRNRKDERTVDEMSIGAIVDGLMRERVFARGVPIGQLASDWAAVVGARLAAESAPVSLDGGVLVVAASDGPWGAGPIPRIGDREEGQCRARFARGAAGAGRRATRPAETLVTQGVHGVRRYQETMSETARGPSSIGRLCRRSNRGFRGPPKRPGSAAACPVPPDGG